MKADCPFCKAISDDSADRVISSNFHCAAILDGYPLTKGHALIVPRRHISSFFETTENERVSLFALLEQVKTHTDIQYSPPAYNIGINDGPEAGQTVAHLHIHLIPRYKDDVADPRGGVRWVIPEKAKYWSKQG